MTRLAVDANIVIALVLGEDYPLVDDFWESISDDDELVGAQLLMPECASVIRRSVFAKRLSIAEGRTAISLLSALPISPCLDRVQFLRSFELAERFRMAKSYDMQYLAAAEVMDAELVTIDGGLRQAAIAVGHPVRFLR